MANRTQGRRIVSVRYRVNVYTDVDVDTGEVVQVLEDDESVRLDSGGGAASTWADTALEVVEMAFRHDGRAYPLAITPQIAEAAVAAAERAVWPAWERP